VVARNSPWERIRSSVPSGGRVTVPAVQIEIFDDEPHPVTNDDPYADVRAAATRLASRYVVDPEEAMALVLALGSERAAMRHLRQLWWRRELELRDPPSLAA
jgi:hypothetical protein